MSTESIQDFILKDEQNLRIAAAVGEAWPEARRQLVDGFLSRLSARLLKELPGWKAENWKEFLVYQYACFYLYKESWVGEYYITLQAHHSGATMQFGVQRDEAILEKRPLDPQLLAAVKEVQPSARSQTWWDAVVAMREPAPDWRAPEILWRMHTDEKFLAIVAEQLLAVARVAESHIDRLTKKQ